MEKNARHIVVIGDFVFRYKIKILFLTVLSIFSLCMVSAKERELPLLGKVIYLDPGHGGLDPGALYKNIQEKDINLVLSQTIQKDLEQLGAIVYLTRYGDYDLSVPNAQNRKRSDLSRRGNIINRSMCDLYFSIHLNAEASSTWKGAQVFYDDINSKNEEIAKIMQESLKKHLNSRREYKQTSTMYLHKRVKRPGALIEVGFLSNENERYLLQQQSYQKKVSLAVTEAILTYFDSM